MQSTKQGTRALLLDVPVLDRVQARDERQKLEATLIAKAKSNQGTVHAPAPMPTQVTVESAAEYVLIFDWTGIRGASGRRVAGRCPTAGYGTAR